MDMTSLSSNLPHNNPSTAEVASEEEDPSSAVLMAGFKQAAYSVTALYKTANEQVDRTRRIAQKEGYQDCLDDLLSLLPRLEGKCDAPTCETIRQWALGKRRKLGNRPIRQEDREPSSESEPAEHQRSSSPMQPPEQPHEQPTPEPSLPVQSVESDYKSTPPPPFSGPPQLGSFTFSSGLQMPRHVPLPLDSSDIELPDNDSPPNSPRVLPTQNMFHQHALQKQFAGHNMNGTRGRHGRIRAGNKRRLDFMSDFFDLAELEKKQQHLGKKGRFQ